MPQANTEGGAAGYNRGRAPRHREWGKKIFCPRLQMSQKIRPRHPTEPYFLRHLEIGFAHIEEAANKLNSFVSANVAQIKRLQVVNFVVFCVVLAYFLKNPCHNTIFSNMKIRITQGTGSYPLPPQGWQRSSLRTVRYSPLKGPCLRKASKAY